ncbi:MAG: LPS assembly lipoprotein LptE [Candidatus Omnitrophota bacterium]
MIYKRTFLAFLLCLTFILSGCGYTTSSLLPPHLKTIYVERFINSIPIAEESSDRSVYRTYHPLLEVDVTKEVIDKFIFDGNLKITQKAVAGLLLEGELIDFSREVTKYGEGENIDQYRIVITVKMKLVDQTTKALMWQEDSFSGSDYYYTSGVQSKSESAAINDAIDDLARRVVQRVVEVW